MPGAYSAFPPVDSVVLPAMPQLTSLNITQPLPSITAATGPAPVQCSDWNTLNGWIAQHPVEAVAVLALGTLAALYLKRK